MKIKQKKKVKRKCENHIKQKQKQIITIKETMAKEKKTKMDKVE